MLSNRELHLYRTAKDSTNAPEAVYKIELDTFAHPVVKSFAFGPDIFWERFTIYVVVLDDRDQATTYSIVSLCPIVPIGCKVSAYAILELQEYVEEEIRREEGYEAAKVKGREDLSKKMSNSWYRLVSDRTRVKQRSWLPNQGYNDVQGEEEQDFMSKQLVKKRVEVQYWFLDFVFGRVERKKGQEEEELRQM